MSDVANRFIWYELATTDAEAAKAFYASVMGWGIAQAEMPGSNYSLFTSGGAPVAGLVELPPPAIAMGASPQWLGYVGVPDVDAAAHQARKLGGSVLVPPTDIPNISRFSVIADPEMAALALIKGRERGRQPASTVKPGQVGWHELHASDLEKAYAFYHELMGWEKAEALESWAGTYQQFAAGGEAIGGIFNKQEEVMPSSIWLYYFMVADVEAASKRVESAGGQIYLGPLAVPGDAVIVRCADPQGALFGLGNSGIRVTIGCYSPRQP